MVLVTVGTQKQPFERLIDLVKTSKELKKEELVIQRGYTKCNNSKRIHSFFEICEELEKEGYILYYRDGETSLDDLVKQIKSKEFAKYDSDSNYIDILRKNI